MQTVQPEAEAAELMTRYGIRRVPADQFHYKDWRYSNLNDAIAQAARDARLTSSDSAPK